MNEVLDSPRQAADSAAISPARLAHVVMRSSQFDVMMTWYQTVLNAKVVFSDGNLGFLAYDDEHTASPCSTSPVSRRKPLAAPVCTTSPLRMHR